MEMEKLFQINNTNWHLVFDRYERPSETTYTNDFISNKIVCYFYCIVALQHSHSSTKTFTFPNIVHKT